jgi:plasmid stabilization system protein ParE
LRDIDAIFDYVAADSPSGAGNILKRIEELCAMLGEYPWSGRPTNRPGVRIYPLVDYPYLIFFRPLPLTRDVRILRVRHAARRPLHLNESAREFARYSRPIP